MVSTNNAQRTYSIQIYKLSQQKPSHIMLLIKKRRPADDMQYLLIYCQKYRSCCLRMFLQARNFIKKRLQHRYFLVNIVKFLRTAFLIEQLWWLLLKVFAQNLIASVWAVTFSTYRSVCLELFLVVTSETILEKKQLYRFRKHELRISFSCFR